MRNLFTRKKITLYSFIIVAITDDNPSNTMLMASSNNGRSWRAWDFGGLVLNDTSCPNTGTCTAGGQSGRMLGVVRSKPRPSSPDGLQHTLNTDLNGLDCPTDTEICYAVGATGKIYATTNGGETWTEKTSGTAQTLWEVSCTSATSCFAVGNSGTILTTDNSGGTWTGETSPETNHLMGVDCSTGQCYAVGSGGIILKKQ